MTASIKRLVTANSTNLTLVKDGPSVVKGIIAVNTSATEFFIKLYWFIPTASADAPTVGTTPVDATIAVPAIGTTTGGLQESFPNGFGKAGRLYMAVTSLAAESDATAVAAGAGLISLLYE